MKSNPLTTDDEYTCHATWAACYQLVQSVLKIGRQVLCYVAKELSQLAVERPWLSLARPFLSLAHTGMETASLPVGAPFLAAFIQENHSLVREP